MAKPKEAPRKYYVGAPDHCDNCNKPFGKLMYDAKIAGGPWGNLCQLCFTRFGVGLGVGKGQRYSMQEDGRWMKTGG